MMRNVIVVVLVGIASYGTAQGFSLGTPEWRFVSSMFQQNDIVLVPCSDVPRDAGDEMLCGNYRWDGEAFMTNWTSLSEYHPPVPVRALDEWNSSGVVHERRFEINGRAAVVRIDGNLVTVRMERTE